MAHDFLDSSKVYTRHDKVTRTRVAKHMERNSFQFCVSDCLLKLPFKVVPCQNSVRIENIDISVTSKQASES